MAIQSFGDQLTEQFFFDGKIDKKCGWSSIKRIVRRKLDMTDYASVLDDLKTPPGNRLKMLAGRFSGFYSIRVNEQWRIIFRWTAAGPAQVRVCDYH